MKGKKEVFSMKFLGREGAVTKSNVDRLLTFQHIYKSSQCSRHIIFFLSSSFSFLLVIEPPFHVENTHLIRLGVKLDPLYQATWWAGDQGS